MTRFRLLICTLAIACLAFPAGARAVTTFGSHLGNTADNSFNCGETCTQVLRGLDTNSRAPGGFAAPADGVVVRWRIKVDSLAPPVKFRIVRPDGTGEFTGAGTSAEETLLANTINEFPTRLPVKQNDLIGIDSDLPVKAYHDEPVVGVSSFAIFGVGPNPPLQDEAAFRPPDQINSPYELLINADLEADDDSDGWGDETQDLCVGEPGPVNNGCPLRGISIADAQINEGDAGFALLSFDVTISGNPGTPATADFSTANGTATAPGDYTPVNQTVTFGPGDLTKTVTVPVIGDSAFEPDETVLASLSNLVNVLPTDVEAQGLIVNEDDPAVDPPDTTRPNTRIVRLRILAPQRRVRVAFSGSDNVGVARFQCRLDRRPWRRCRSPKVFRNVRPGRHTFRVRAIDAAGNVDATPAKRRFRMPLVQNR